MTEDPDFKGYIHDVGGPTANFRKPACKKQMKVGVCKNRQCLFPEPCPNMEIDHTDYVSLLRKLRALPKVKKSLCAPAFGSITSSMTKTKRSSASLLNTTSAASSKSHRSIFPTACCA